MQRHLRSDKRKAAAVRDGLRMSKMSRPALIVPGGTYAGIGFFRE
jgi:hypothetical protein